MISKGKRIKKLRESHNMTQDKLAEISNTSKQTIYKYETDKITNIPSDKIEAMAEAFGVSPAYLMGWDDNIYPISLAEENIRIKVYGSVPAGVPIEAIEDVVDFEDIPAEMAAGGKEFIGLRVQGSSMYPKYIEGDTIIIQIQDDCESGQDVVIYVNGYDATLKKIIKNEDGTITLKPINPEYQEHSYGPGDDPVKLLGVVRELRRSV